MAKWKVTAIAAGAAVGGASIQNIALVWWTSGSGARETSPFAVLFVGALYFLLTFLILIGVRAFAAGGDWMMYMPSHDPAQNILFSCCMRRRDGDGTAGRGCCSGEWTMMQLTMAIGALGTLNSLMNVYASPPTRTPPLVQTVLLNAGVLFAVPLSKFFLGDKKVYCSLKPLVAGFLIAASVSISLLPSVLFGLSPPAAGRRLLADASEEGFIGGVALTTEPVLAAEAHGLGGGVSLSALNPFLWSLVYLFSNLPWAADCIVEQAFLLRAGAHDDDMPASELATVTLRLLFWQALWQVVFIWSICFVDLLPWFGFSATFSEFRENTVHGIVCSMAGPRAAHAVSGWSDGCTTWAPAWAVAMAGGYVISYIADAVLIRVSASLSMLNYVLIAAVTTAVWLIPGVNPEPSNTPLWSVSECRLARTHVWCT